MVACRKAVVSLAVGKGTTVAAKGVALSSGGGSNWNIHKGSSGVRWPVNMVCPLAVVMVTDEEVKVATMPASHSCPIEMSDPRKLGKMWHKRAGRGSWGNGRRAWWVEVTVVPSGRWTVMGWGVMETSVRQDRSLQAM